ncbi:hypothetical protein V9T20_12930 (plasmid) [Halobacterium salinarum]|jgi:hypothetical protein|uniref:hypothetical protein n=1 Tax=Halobacterium salinarum TaxID=2242 RepID=UPI0030CD01A7
MPFLARREDVDGFVVPEEVADGETVFCPHCDGRMRPRGASNQQARHFMHVDNLSADANNRACNGLAGESIGESVRHRIWKSLAVSGLQTRFADFDVREYTLEHEVDVSKGPSLLDTRRADAIVRFLEPITNPNLFFGEGVIVEVQHHNETKDIAKVTADYLSAGYSVYWAHDADFTETQFRVDRFERAFNERWPNAFAPYFIDAETALHMVDKVEFDPRELAEQDWSFNDPRPNCQHSLHTGHQGLPFCLDCGTRMRRHDTGRRMYLPLGKQ